MNNSRTAHIYQRGATYQINGGGVGFETIAAALRAACRNGYTHATGNGCYWGGNVRSIEAWRG